MYFITNGFKHFLKTNSTDPRQRVPLTWTLKYYFCAVLNREKRKRKCVTLHCPMAKHNHAHVYQIMTVNLQDILLVYYIAN